MGQGNVTGNFVEERRLERPTPTSRTWCATNCATPRVAFGNDDTFVFLHFNAQKSKLSIPTYSS